VKTPENTTSLTLFGHCGTEKKVARVTAATTTATTTTTTSDNSNSYSNSNSNSNSNNTSNNNKNIELYDQSVARRTSTTKITRKYTR